ncbi:MAG: DNA polymerase III subunit gamma/tau [Anaerovoracaceae bacterium]|jgi:DNA polymerase-3 subunit gamma/tau
MQQALYRAFRPEVFEEILGQEHIVKILKNQLKSGAVSHAYLFCGTRGTGKTSIARILAKGVNCIGSDAHLPCGKCSNCISIKEGTFLDVIEIDAASHTGVDNIRELRETVKYPPIIGRFKTYIIDEVHMLSTGAFNALLKTLEEPPENVMFILATTEPQKLPATIISRCLRLDFRRLPEGLLRDGMRQICRKLEVKISDSALGLIAANADGAARDALSLLDQCISTGLREITRQDVLDVLGISGEETFIRMTDMVVQGDVAGAILFLDESLAGGKDVRLFMKEWIAHYRSLLLVKYVKNPESMLNLSEENVERIRDQSVGMDLIRINEGIIEISKALSEAKWSTQPRILLELCIVRLAEAHGGPRHEERAKDRNLDGIWCAIIEEGEAQKGSFSLIRATTLDGIGDETFRVKADNQVSMRFLEENRQLLEDLMEKRSGKRLSMICGMGNENDMKKGCDPVEAMAENIARRFDIDVEIE